MKLSLKEQAVIAMIKECIQPLLELKKGFEKQENRADDITEGMPVEKYPSVNAVINFVKNKITDFSNDLNTVYVKLLDFEVYKKNIKTSFENFEKGIADTYATKSGIDDFKNSVADTYATKTDIEDFEENVADTYATKTIVEDLKNDTEITRTATGSAITIDSAKAPLQNLKLFGKTTQNGTPTPSTPVPLVSVGDSGSFETWLCGKNMFDGIFEQGHAQHNSAAPTRVRIKNLIPISKGKKYTVTKYNDTNNNFVFCVLSNITPKAYPLGHQCGTVNEWCSNSTYSFVATNDGVLGFMVKRQVDTTNISPTDLQDIKFQVEIGDATPYEPCNKQSLTMPYTLPSMDTIKQEVDFNKGIIVKKIGVTTITSSDNISISRFTDDTNNNWNTRFFVINKTTDGGFAKNDVVATSDYFPAIVCFDQDRQGIYSHRKGVGIRIDKSLLADVSTQENAIQSFKNWLSDKTVNVVYQLPETIETPLTETELNAYRHLMTNKGNNTFLSEVDAEISFYRNTNIAQSIGNIHSQVNKDYFKLQQAIIETGGN